MQDKNTFNIGQKMKEARESANFSVIKIAKELGITRQTYSFLENGQVDPRYTMLKRFAAITNKPMTFFSDDTAYDLRINQKLINTGRNQGIIYACRQLAELFNHVELATQLIETIGVSIDSGREKDAEKLKELIQEKLVVPRR